MIILFSNICHQVLVLKDHKTHIICALLLASYITTNFVTCAFLQKLHVSGRYHLCQTVFITQPNLFGTVLNSRCLTICWYLLIFLRPNDMKDFKTCFGGYFIKSRSRNSINFNTKSLSEVRRDDKLLPRFLSDMAHRFLAQRTNGLVLINSDMSTPEGPTDKSIIVVRYDVRCVRCLRLTGSGFNVCIT